MDRQLNALTMERRLAAQRLAKLAGKDAPPAATSNPPKPLAKKGKAVEQRYSVLSIKPQ